VRVHFSSIGHPIVGDTVYGYRRRRVAVPRQFLHAWQLSFRHPVEGKDLSFTAELAADLVQSLDELRLLA